MNWRWLENSTWILIHPDYPSEPLSTVRHHGHGLTPQAPIGAHVPWPTESHDPKAALRAAIEHANPDGYHSHKRGK